MTKVAILLFCDPLYLLSTFLSSLVYLQLQCLTQYINSLGYSLSYATLYISQQRKHGELNPHPFTIINDSIHISAVVWNITIQSWEDVKVHMQSGKSHTNFTFHHFSSFQRSQTLWQQCSTSVSTKIVLKKKVTHSKVNT